MRSVSGEIRFGRSYPLASFGLVQNFERTPPDKYVRWVNVTHAIGMRFVRLSCGLSVSHAFRTDFPGRVRRAHSVIIQNDLSVSYTVNIRFVRFTSVTLTLIDRSLSVTCSVRMRSLQLPRRLTSPDKHFLHFFCPPLSVDM